MSMIKQTPNDWYDQGINARKVISKVYTLFCTAVYCLRAEK